MNRLEPRLCYGVLAFLHVLSVALIALFIFLRGEVDTENNPVVMKEAIAFKHSFRHDALHYYVISNRGYEHDDTHASVTAFFPVYPLVCRSLAQMSGVRIQYVMLLVSYLSFVACSFVLLHLSVSPLKEYGIRALYVPVLFILLPVSLWSRMPYSESLIMLFLSLLLLGVERKWPLVILAVLSGLATATRPVGIAAALAVWCYALTSRQRSPLPTTPLPPGERGASWLHVIWLVPLSCWGLLAYIVYLWYAFDAPFAFAQTQQHWSFLAPTNYTFWDKVWSLLTLEPIWNVYNPNSQRYWMNGEISSNPLFSCQFWNPIFYLLAWFLIGLGWYKKWLKDYEIVLSVGLLLIPYVTRAYEMSMASHARFAAVVIPQYFVLGRLFAMMPPAIAGCLCGLMGLMMGLWTALFVAGYRFF